MNDLIKIAVVALIVYFVWDYMKEKKLTLSEMFVIHPHNSFNQPTNPIAITINNQKEIDNNNINNEYVVDNKTQVETINHSEFPNKTIVIKSLGNVDYSDITDAVRIIKGFYGFNCIIGDNEPISDDMYIKGANHILNADICLNKLFSQQNVLYIVDKELWARGDYLRGYAAVNGGTAIVRGEKSFLQETIIHELGHTLGLGHCGDLSCVMAIDNDVYDSGNFCKNCKRRLNIYE